MRVLASPAFSNRDRNPYQALLYTAMMSQGTEVREYAWPRLVSGSYHVWHLHWPESSLNAPAVLDALIPAVNLLAMMAVARRRGVKIVWTVHNVAEHEKRHPHLARWFWKKFVCRLDACINLTTAGQAIALDRFPALARLPRFVIPMGHYRDAYPSTMNGESARARLGLPPDGTVIGFVGHIRAYKNVPALISAFRGLPDEAAKLLIAGDPRPKALAAPLYEAARRDSRVRLHIGFAADDVLERYLKAADLLVFPFLDMLNSASIMLALSFDRPILVPAKPSLLELQALVGSQWVHTYEGELTSDVLQSTLERVKRSGVTGRPSLDAFSWPRIAAQTVEAYRQITGLPATSAEPTAMEA